MPWSLVAVDRRGAFIGDVVQVEDLRLRFAFNRLSTVAGKVLSRHFLAPYLVLDDKTLIKAYSHDLDTNGVEVGLQFCGPITSHQKVVDEQGGSLAFTASSAAWRLARRLVGKSQIGGSIGTPGAPVSRGLMASNLLNMLNSGDAATLFTSAGDTGLRPGSIDSTMPAGWAGPWWYKPALDALSEIAAPLDGFDWRDTPVEPVPDALGVQIAKLDVVRTWGIARPDAVLEYGAGRRNVNEYSEIGDAEQLLNDGYNLPPGFPDNATQAVQSWSDGTSIGDRGLYEGLVSSDVTVDALRLKLVQEHVAVRKVPKRVWTLTVDPNSGLRYGIDFREGDIVPFRATEPVETRDPADPSRVTGHRDTKTIDASARVYVVELTLDQLGNVTPKLTIVEEA